MSLAATTYVLAQRFGSQGRKLLMLAVADAADDEGRNSHQSVDTLAHKAECSTRSVQRLLRELEQAGHVAVEWGQGPRGTNRVRILFQKLPPGFSHAWQGRHGGTPAVQKPTTIADHQTTEGGDNRGPSLSPEQSGTVREPKERESGRASAPETAIPHPPTADADGPFSQPPEFDAAFRLAQVFPHAPTALSRPEANLLLELWPHLRDLSEDDWTACQAWQSAPDRVRGRKLWPRSRREWLENFFEAIQHIRRWWPSTGRRWWSERQGLPLQTQKPPAPDAPVEAMDKAEALAFLAQPLANP